MDERITVQHAKIIEKCASEEIKKHLEHSEELGIAIYGDNDSITVECQKCDCIIIEIYNSENHDRN